YETLSYLTEKWSSSIESLALLGEIKFDSMSEHFDRSMNIIHKCPKIKRLDLGFPFCSKSWDHESHRYRLLLNKPLLTELNLYGLNCYKYEWLLETIK